MSGTDLCSLLLSRPRWKHAFGVWSEVFLDILHMLGMLAQRV